LKRKLPSAASKFEAGLAPQASFAANSLWGCASCCAHKSWVSFPGHPLASGAPRQAPGVCPSGQPSAVQIDSVLSWTLPSGERCSSHSAPGGMVAPGELVFCLPKRQVCQEQTWTREARPKGSHQGGCESAKPKKRAPGWRADPARRRLEPGATEGTSLCLCRRTRSLACPFGRFRLKPTMLGRAIRDDSVVP
jgi:hypothetical protein